MRWRVLFPVVVVGCRSSHMGDLSVPCKFFTDQPCNCQFLARGTHDAQKGLLGSVYEVIRMPFWHCRGRYVVSC